MGTLGCGQSKLILQLRSESFNVSMRAAKLPKIVSTHTLGGTGPGSDLDLPGMRPLTALLSSPWEASWHAKVCALTMPFSPSSSRAKYRQDGSKTGDARRALVVLCFRSLPRCYLLSHAVLAPQRCSPAELLWDDTKNGFMALTPVHRSPPMRMFRAISEACLKREDPVHKDTSCRASPGIFEGFFPRYIVAQLW